MQWHHLWRKLLNYTDYILGAAGFFHFPAAFFLLMRYNIITNHNTGDYYDGYGILTHDGARS